ncbi:uncharacterized protein BJ212DRAFT_1304434 [Suillus subaureus]|uniref:Fungal-type protein kinase domain-containing protein n=1 Tax=Suillus subaureus TaxID=48587 RepID=A0A9P7J5R6_9AGAM|nr:uncharacterized protein BJ212DRAFT_1304434 [Suillus subaureus]KAG1804135.1 hypothetical protein BJ212DRAFT_1304434 [Suillus subaureus]
MSKDRSGNESGSSPVLPPSFPPDDASPENSPSETFKLYKQLFLPPGSQVAIKDCWPTVEVIPEGYILDCLGGEDLKIDPGFNHINGIPTKVIDRFIRGNMQLPPYEGHVHYHMVTEDVCVNLSWFSHKKEFFSAILKALKAHKFAVECRKILHQGISPANIWLCIRKLKSNLAIPIWENDKPPPIRLALLGDWGMATLLPGFEWEKEKSKIEISVQREPELGFKDYNTSHHDCTHMRFAKSAQGLPYNINVY